VYYYNQSAQNYCHVRTANEFKVMQSRRKSQRNGTSTDNVTADDENENCKICTIQMTLKTIGGGDIGLADCLQL